MNQMGVPKWLKDFWNNHAKLVLDYETVVYFWFRSRSLMEAEQVAKKSSHC